VALTKVAVQPADGHGLRLLRSHAGGAGALASAACHGLAALSGRPT
jgi:hypothetical protein